MYFYSVSTLGFYSDMINTFIPDDAIQLTDADYQQLMDAQSNGKSIQPDENGLPVAVDSVSD